MTKQENEWADIPDGKYETFDIETRPGCSRAIVTYCGDSMGIIKRYLWIPDNIRVQILKEDANDQAGPPTDSAT